VEFFSIPSSAQLLAPAAHGAKKGAECEAIPLLARGGTVERAAGLRHASSACWPRRSTVKSESNLPPTPLPCPCLHFLPSDSLVFFACAVFETSHQHRPLPAPCTSPALPPLSSLLHSPFPLSGLASCLSVARIPRKFRFAPSSGGSTGACLSCADGAPLPSVNEGVCMHSAPPPCAAIAIGARATHWSRAGRCCGVSCAGPRLGLPIWL
jgi:hypothetical protein